MACLQKLCVCHFPQPHLRTTLKEENNVNVDCRNCASDVSKTQKNKVWYFSKAHLLTILVEKNDVNVDCRNCAFDDSKTRKTTIFLMLWHAFRNCLFWYFAKEHLLTTLKTKRMMGTSTVEIVRLMIPKHEKTTLCYCYGVPSETDFLAIWPKRIYL